MRGGHAGHVPQGILVAKFINWPTEQTSAEWGQQGSLRHIPSGHTSLAKNLLSMAPDLQFCINYAPLALTFFSVTLGGQTSTGNQNSLRSCGSADSWTCWISRSLTWKRGIFIFNRHWRVLLIAVWETWLLKLVLPKCHLVNSPLKGLIPHGVLKPGFRTRFLEASLLHGSPDSARAPQICSVMLIEWMTSQWEMGKRNWGKLLMSSLCL